EQFLVERPPGFGCHVGYSLKRSCLLSPATMNLLLAGGPGNTILRRPVFQATRREAAAGGSEDMDTQHVVEAKGSWKSAAAPLRVAEPVTVVILGATGDLTARKLLPALFSLWHDQYLPDRFAVVGVGRRDKTDDQFRGEMQASAKGHEGVH